MPRIKVELPERFIFATEIPVRARHINGAGHVDNAQMVVLISEAREAFFVGLGYQQNDVEGVGTVITDAAFQYLAEAFEGETLVFGLAANDFNKYGGDIVCRVSDRETGREVARAKLGFVFFDYTTRKVAPIPPRFLERVNAA
ncbi:thioesterase family protein [Aromatoleum toluclasticum]|uniref:acyl-CoA thioesterase n=1 Tax=Aromatoleum toluclasticum TaxID=92003 RepID=UPI000370A1BC|nr:thioesterase family protein [Aromatoleum toluclasticum]MCC4117324.1 thioesterase family protein [Aromatoleum toluclasticum]